MRKIKLNIAIFSVVLSAFFVSCDKDVESTALELNMNKKATVKLYVYADLDKTQSGYEAAPKGTQLQIKIYYSSFTESKVLKSASDGAWTKTVTVDSSGTVSLSVPADDDGVTIFVTAKPFEYEQVQPYGSHESKIRKIFTSDGLSKSITAGSEVIDQIVYDGTESYEDFTPMVTVAGYLTAEINDTIAGTEEITETVSMVFHTSEWAQEINAVDGAFVIDVPANVDILVTSSFQTENYVGGNFVDYDYELKAKNIGKFTVDTEDKVIDFGTGTEVE